ncbi:MAG: hypothetical protein K2G28_09285, partial [Acetatifactor sp.]|nr:hypothetical protein [Acetatifactor sp.]
ILDEVLTKWEEMGYTFRPLSDFSQNAAGTEGGNASGEGAGQNNGGNASGEGAGQNNGGNASGEGAGQSNGGNVSGNESGQGNGNIPGNGQGRFLQDEKPVTEETTEKDSTGPEV